MDLETRTRYLGGEEYKRFVEAGGTDADLVDAVREALGDEKLGSFSKDEKFYNKSKMYDDSDKTIDSDWYID